VTGGEGVRIEYCEVRNCGGTGIVLHGRNHTAAHCHVHHVGETGIALRGGKFETLEPGGCSAEDNEIHHFGELQRVYTPGVALGAPRNVGLRASRNHIHHGPHVGILSWGNDNLIEYNDIHDVLHEASEGGAIYVGLDWTMRGNIIRYNIFHHIQKHCSPHATHGSRAIHIDDLFSGLNVYGNAFYRIADSAAIALGGGRDTLIENNVFVDCHSAVSMGARGLGWAQHIVVEGGALRKKLAEMPYQEPPWSLRFPQLLTILQDDQPGAPKGNVIAHNVLSGGRWLESDSISLELADTRDNWTEGDPGFVDAAERDFRPREDSPVYGRIGFAAVPLERAGCCQDELRASWPIVRAVGQYYRPQAAAQTAASAPRPQYLVQRRLNEVTIDGRVDEAEWTLDRDDFVPEMPIGQDPHGAKIDPPGRAYVLHDDQNLYVALRAPIQPAGAVALGDAWGKHDAADVSLQAVGGARPGPVFNLQGFASGALKSTSDAGAPEAAARALLEATAYAATVREDEWSAEWRIPWQAVGIDPAATETVRFSVGLRRTSGPQGQPAWMVWRGGGSTWNVETGGGDLVLRK
ncbi:MAG TPA: right-handed parallel beta-helix repeat-containing protein, partial [Armatimonadota bacterium]|nr:right-handed parallel beta-helix repeat-containing protein [Armatimonadota bacterium]